MKAAASDHVQHLVIIDVDGVAEDVLVADDATARKLAELVLTAAERLSTVRIPLGISGNGPVVTGQL